MTLVKRNNGLTSDRYVPSVAQFFDDFFTRDFFDWPSTSNTGTTIPKVNIQETDNEFRVEMAAPGMKKDDFKVELDNNVLSISSEFSKDEAQHTDSKYSRREFSYQSFQRSFRLPETVEADKIKAKYEDGVLHLLIPKREEAKRKPARTIKIS
ncbi:Hsp20/alpha crystallin family protein [Catalinimonas niigatensis]|uniref:Hsp20/alpha crystallin family protein n=1 Tax=Catalinimonas niigatensis TaxID=1397264 RepID=UPI0026671932|nr:Hsp20/alpha crystallin family protein [Catalinimonas niigatensis]WPP48654.1 Hsp20/alpha crystallin family protein [Catalinimonas niigatensis]